MKDKLIIMSVITLVILLNIVGFWFLTGGNLSDLINI